MRRVAVIGGGLTGLTAAYELAKEGMNVILYEKEDVLGGHAKTINVDGLDLDLHSLVFNRVTFPHLTDLFDSLDVDTEASDISFSLSLDKGAEFKWGSETSLRSLFAQWSNLVKPNFWNLCGELKKFKNDAIMYLDEHENSQDMNLTEGLGHFINSHGYSEFFQKAYLVPLCSSLWCCSQDKVMELSALSILSFCRDHYLFQLSGHPQWLTVKGGSRNFVKKLQEEIEIRGSQIKTNCEVHSVMTSDNGCRLIYGKGVEDIYDACIMAVPAPNAIKLLGEGATHEELRILGAFQYICSDVFLHRDESFMPSNQVEWSAWNFLKGTDGEMYSTCWLNVLQNISETSLPFLATLNPPHPPKNALLKWSTWRLLPTIATTKASLGFDMIQGKRGIWFSEAYHGKGSHEEKLKAGMLTANALLGKRVSFLKNPKQMAPSFTEAAARIYVIRFLKHFISAGCLILLEEGGEALTFNGSDKSCAWKSALRVHNPTFYWKVATDNDLGVADAFINGDISFVDKNEGLLNFFMVILANLYLYPPTSEVKKTSKYIIWSRGFEGWWGHLFTAARASAKYFHRVVFRRNTIKQSRQNIAHHYDVSNEMFSLFLDKTMTYSCAIFKSENEDLTVAQLRKLHLLIDKAKIEEHHELLDIGCGWGSLAIEAVKKTGCRCTGITLAEEQVKLAEQRVKEAGLQDRIKILLCDYRELPSTHKYDRIISCGMLEHVGDEYYEVFFRQCDSLLADNGILVVQTISAPDDQYEERSRNTGYATECVFPGGCLPSLSRLTSAMVAASRLCVEHAETIGINYVQTLRSWRKNFLENESKIRSLGFDDKFMRAWEYYFDYCAAGFLTRTISVYQIVFSRQGNLVAFKDRYASIPSVHSCA